MVEAGAIRRSFSPWANAVMLVRKKDGGLRFCIDLRKLNNRTVKDGYSLPRIEDTLDCLHGAVWFSTLDLKSGYWQVELEEEAKPLTAFTVGPLGFLECEHMPFGLTNAPATFQRLMESYLGELHLNCHIIYLDDIIVFSRTPEEHIHRLKAVFEKLKAAGLKLKPSKCDFFKKEIKYLGHVVSEQGVSTDPDKIKAVTEWPQPTTVTEVRSFFGFVSYYRRFIPNFSKVAKPLNKLLQNLEGTPSQKKNLRFIGDLNNKRPLRPCKDSVQNLHSLLMQTLRPLLFSTQMLVEMNLVLYCIRFRRGNKESWLMPLEVCQGVRGIIQFISWNS